MSKIQSTLVKKYPSLTKKQKNKNKNKQKKQNKKTPKKQKKFTAKHFSYNGRLLTLYQHFK